MAYARASVPTCLVSDWCEAGTRHGHYNCWLDRAFNNLKMYSYKLWCTRMLAGTRHGHYNCWLSKRMITGNFPSLFSLCSPKLGLWKSQLLRG